MRIYEATTREFSDDVLSNSIEDKVARAFRDHYGHAPSPSEARSWTNSLTYVEHLIRRNELFENYIVVEYELPYTSSRIDCLLFGRGQNDGNSVLLMELKQWSEVAPSAIEGNVETYVAGGRRTVAHPSHQAKAYALYLKDFVSIFDEGDTSLSPCVYCHNYVAKKGVDPLLDDQFEGVMEEVPLFLRHDVEGLGHFLNDHIGKGDGLELYGRFRGSNIRPSRKLLDYTSQIVKGDPMFNLIDDQLAAYNAIMDLSRRAAKAKAQTVVLVRGGPGTGKSVIALNVLAELASKGVTVMHATGSKTFTSIVQKIVGPRSRNHFRYFNSFTPDKVSECGVNVLICDEAHRIRETSNTRFQKRSDVKQIDELLRAARVVIFFIDDFQVVRAGEVGSSQLIAEAAQKRGIRVHEYQLQSQFRCAGSDGILSWVNNTLEVHEGVKTLTSRHKLDFRIFDTPQSLYAEIVRHHTAKPNSARLVAGFCWQWSKPQLDGTLVNDVVIGDFQMPWEGKDPQETKIPLAKGIPPWYLWGHDPDGIHQIGCIYTVQGLEFDYIGVIFGNDLVYNPDKETWETRMENCHDGQLKRQRGDYLRYLKNIYRVLLTRGMKGCYVYFLDKQTEQFVRSRLGDGIIS